MKKLLGLLAITPMAVTACGSADPVVKEEVRELEINYNLDEKTLIINNLDLSGDTDHVAYNTIGDAISNKVKENTIVGEATHITMKGLLNGEEYTKETDVYNILDQSGQATFFNSLLEVINHSYLADGQFTILGVMARNIKGAGEHIDSSIPDASIINDFRTESELNIENYDWNIKYPEKPFTKAFEEYQREVPGKFPKYIYTAEEFNKWYGVEEEDYNYMMSQFENSYYKFIGSPLKSPWLMSFEFAYDRSDERIGIWQAFTKFHPVDDGLITKDTIIESWNS